MTAFNTASNTGSTTFTNAYATIDLLPSGSAQYAFGFPRTTGWRYWEAYVDDQGGDPSRLFMGMHHPPNLYNDGLVYGGNSVLTSFKSGTINPGYPYITTATSLTARTGDVFMFSVDMTGAGRDHAGTVVDVTLSSGTGTLLTPMTVEIGKNGVWNGEVIHGWSWPAGGWPMRGMPVIIRDSTSASYARVSLRVVTTSFAYAIPSGMVAWADGPEGATSVATLDATVVWDQANSGAGSRCSISGAGLYAVFQGTGENPTMGYAMTTNLSGLTGKRMLEVIPSSTTTTYCYDNTFTIRLGLIDSTTITLTALAIPANSLIDQSSSNFYSRGATWVGGSLTNIHSNAMDGQLKPPNFGMAIDFDNAKMWFMSPQATSGINTFPFTGLEVAPTWTEERVCPYSWGATSSNGGIPISITAASTVLRLFAVQSMLYTHHPQPMTLKINASGPGWSYPFPLPGLAALNGNSVQPGWGDSWDAVNIPASATYGAAGLAICPLYIGAAQGARTYNSGKKYFEIYSEGDKPQTASTWDWSVGVRKDSATTLTWGVSPNPSSVLDNALMAYEGLTNPKLCRYGVTLSWTNTMSTGYGSNVTIMSSRILVAVDFDAGNIWFGHVNQTRSIAEWGTGRDPGTGTNPHMTFTASTTMRIFMTFGMFGGSPGSATNRYILVQDDNNVVGLPTGFTTWGGTAPVSLTATPSGSVSPTASAVLGGRVLWPYGVQT